jgi:hypothetical protein
MWGSYIYCLSVVRAVSVKSAVFWDVKLCKLIDIYWYFRAICSLHLTAADGGSRLHSYVHTYLPDSMTSNSRIQETSSVSCCNFYLLCSFCFVHWPSRVRLEPDSPRKRPHNLHETYQLPSVQVITPDDGHRRCPKHVVSWQNKFGYLMHLVGYFIRM